MRGKVINKPGNIYKCCHKQQIAMIYKAVLNIKNSKDPKEKWAKDKVR